MILCTNKNDFTNACKRIRLNFIWSVFAMLVLLYTVMFQRENLIYSVFNANLTVVIQTIHKKFFLGKTFYFLDRKIYEGIVFNVLFSLSGHTLSLCDLSTLFQYSVNDTIIFPLLHIIVSASKTLHFFALINLTIIIT